MKNKPNKNETMKKLITACTAALFATALFAGAPAALSENGEGEKVSLKIDTKQSKIFWTGKKVTGQHNGTLMIKSGFVELEDEVPTKVHIEFDLTTIVCEDLKDPGTNAKLIGHLKSDDFFSVKKYPVGTFTATEFTPISGAEGRDANYTVKGDLTIKGITGPVEFEAFISAKGKMLVSNGDLTFDRTKYDIRYGSGSFFDGLGDKMIYDDVELTYVISTGLNN